MNRMDELWLETKIMDLLWSEYNENNGDFDNDRMRNIMDNLHNCVERAACDFAYELELEYTPVY